MQTVSMTPKQLSQQVFETKNLPASQLEYSKLIRSERADLEKTIKDEVGTRQADKLFKFKDSSTIQKIHYDTQSVKPQPSQSQENEAKVGDKTIIFPQQLKENILKRNTQELSSKIQTSEVQPISQTTKVSDVEVAKTSPTFPKPFEQQAGKQTQTLSDRQQIRRTQAFRELPIKQTTTQPIIGEPKLTQVVSTKNTLSSPPQMKASSPPVPPRPGQPRPGQPKAPPLTPIKLSVSQLQNALQGTTQEILTKKTPTPPPKPRSQTFGQAKTSTPIPPPKPRSQTFGQAKTSTITPEKLSISEPKNFKDMSAQGKSSQASAAGERKSLPVPPVKPVAPKKPLPLTPPQMKELESAQAVLKKDGMKVRDNEKVSPPNMNSKPQLGGHRKPQGQIGH
jgi:hypothetical protein